MNVNDRMPRFKVGDHVVVLNPVSDRGKLGVVIHVSEHAGDFVHRYSVKFDDGSSKRYFGFELDPTLARSA